MSDSQSKILVPHPEWPDLSSTTLKKLYLENDEKLSLFEALGSDADPQLHIWTMQELRGITSELNRRGIKPYSSPHLTEAIPAELNFQLLSWNEYLSNPTTDQKWTVQNLLPDSGLGVLQGRGKQGKSTLVRHLCAAVANGNPFLGYETTSKPIIYINYEMSDAYMQLLLGSAEVPLNNAFILNWPEPILRIGTVQSLMNKPEANNALIVVDSFRGAFKLTGDKENSAGEAGVLLRELQSAALANHCFILIIHHRNRRAGEGTDSISGTGDWIAAPDVIWSWTRQDATKPGTLFIEGRLPPVEPLSIRLNLKECVCLGTAKETQAETDKQSILAVLSDEGQSSESIAEAAKLPPGTARARLDSLFGLGLIERDGSGRRGSPYLWSRKDSAERSLHSAETNIGEWEEVADGTS